MSKTAAMFVALAALAGPVAAQTTNPPAGTNPPRIIAAPPKLVMPPDPSDLTNSLDALKPSVKIVSPTIVTSGEKPERPAKPAELAPTTAVKNLVENFQRAREEFIARQRAVTTVPREQFAEQQRQKWEEERARLRQEIRDRVVQIRNEFRSRELLEVLDAAKEAAKRKRPGED
jgi:hypothetical protein